jgi:Uma2 family endonuclease
MLASSSMSGSVATPPGERVATADQRLVRYSVPWSHFEVELALRGDRSSPRMAYLQGALEIMSPSKDHERIKSYIGMLVEAYALETGLDLSAYGGWTLKNAPAEAGVEPDECYILGSDQGKPAPDLAIEVVWTSGGINKLEIYRRLGIGEVWFWKDDAIRVYRLVGSRFEEAERSGVFPNLDLALLTSLLDRPTALQAVRALREALAR